MMNDFETVTRIACDGTGSPTEKTHFTIDIRFARLDTAEGLIDVDVPRDYIDVTTDRLVRGRVRFVGEDGGIRRRPFVMNRYIETRTPLTANPTSFTAIIAFRTVQGVDFQRFYANFEYRLAEGGAVHVHVSVTYWQQLPALDDAHLFETSRFSQEEVFNVGEDTVRAFAREQQEGFDQVRADMQQDQPINVELVGTDFGLMNVDYPPNPFAVAFQFQRFLLPEMIANSAVDPAGPAIENYFMSESTERLPYEGGHVLETERRFRKGHNGLVDVSAL